MRCFVAIDLPETLADAIGDAQERFRDAAGLRFVDPSQAHITLKFLGDVDPDQTAAIMNAIETAVAAAGVGPFRCTLGGFGAFPSPEYITVVWAGVHEGAERVSALQEPIERELVAVGFDPEQHEFTPHVTLARMDDARGKDRVQRELAADASIGGFEVSEVRLKESVLGEDGPTYRTIDQIQLPADTGP
ncbi:RNA 2',3'-cyclic phosphodiesterase [Halalkalirubrum salinum]|uniref:RNA 2',3'-cyclic phosphodiesterase n=1 Tax=Halalkalirubrum salinum TaxID=2563889 RepID=UPI0010FAE8B5|nr:RNA 2',3'-cyclic phosphodiesterase [Halalkalirubrum salinum]